MRAKEENSSTMRPMSPTCRMIVSVHWSKISRSSTMTLPKRAADALGRKLDRRQRVLDLVGDAARDVGPGRRCAAPDEIGDVVERDDVGIVGDLGLAVLERDLDVEGALGAGAVEGDLLAVDRPARLAADLEDAADMRQDGEDVLADARLRRDARAWSRPSG